MSSLRDGVGTGAIDADHGEQQCKAGEEQDGCAVELWTSQASASSRRCRIVLAANTGTWGSIAWTVSRTMARRSSARPLTRTTMVGKKLPGATDPEKYLCWVLVSHIVHAL